LERLQRRRVHLSGVRKPCVDLKSLQSLAGWFVEFPGDFTGVKLAFLERLLDCRDRAVPGINKVE